MNDRADTWRNAPPTAGDRLVTAAASAANLGSIAVVAALLYFNEIWRGPALVDVLILLAMGALVLVPVLNAAALKRARRAPMLAAGDGLTLADEVTRSLQLDRRLEALETAELRRLGESSERCEASVDRQIGRERVERR
ncbi:MAG TPA: hypothetical protein VK610_05555 [Rhodothermales bacterium]|nr:hypothetical protein [Rhodothermales bacterium]